MSSKVSGNSDLEPAVTGDTNTAAPQSISANTEAAKQRHRAKEYQGQRDVALIVADAAVAEADAARAQLDASRRQLAEQHVKSKLAEAGDIWRGGYEVPMGEGGLVDLDAVDRRADELITAHPHLKRYLGPFTPPASTVTGGDYPGRVHGSVLNPATPADPTADWSKVLRGDG